MRGDSEYGRTNKQTNRQTNMHSYIDTSIYTYKHSMATRYLGNLDVCEQFA